jgi:gliding motility associated protien GldN
MKARFSLIISMSLVKVFSYSQGNLGPSNVVIPNGQPQSGVIDGVYEKKDVLSKKRAIPYEFVRENDYVWGKRTWSYIDLREKINHPLYFPHESIDKKGSIILGAQGRYSLYYILLSNIIKGYIQPYMNSVEATLGGTNAVSRSGGDDFSMPVKRNWSIPNVEDDSDFQESFSEISGMKEMQNDNKPFPKQLLINGNPTDVFIRKGVYSDPSTIVPKKYEASDSRLETLVPKFETLVKDSAETLFDANLNQNIEIPSMCYSYTIKFFEPKSIVKYYLKEDWFFDKERSILDVRTIGLAPVAYEDSTSMKEKILFWVYFPQVRDVLKNYYVYDPKSTVGGNTFDHLFMTRRFNAVVFKESTLYDRKIEDYRFGADALYESEKVKNTIRTFEHDVWNF